MRSGIKLETLPGHLRAQVGTVALTGETFPCLNCGTPLKKGHTSSLCRECACPLHFGFAKRVCGCR